MSRRVRTGTSATAVFTDSGIYCIDHHQQGGYRLAGHQTPESCVGSGLVNGGGRGTRSTSFPVGHAYRLTAIDAWGSYSQRELQHNPNGTNGSFMRTSRHILGDLPRIYLLNCLKRLDGSKTKALQAKETRYRGPFRCGLLTICPLAIPLSYYSDSLTFTSLDE
jgi:hypothetical protein